VCAEDRFAFHLDAVDACRDVLNHGVKDTRAVKGMLIGAGLAAFLVYGLAFCTADRFALPWGC